MPHNYVYWYCKIEALSGTYDTNPYEFHHHNVNFVQVLINGQESAIGGYTQDFSRNHYTNEYLSLFRGKNRLDMDYCNDVSLKIKSV